MNFISTGSAMLVMLGKLAFNNNSEQRKRDEFEEEITTLVLNILKFRCPKKQQSGEVHKGSSRGA